MIGTFDGCLSATVGYQHRAGQRATVGSRVADGTHEWQRSVRAQAGGHVQLRASAAGPRAVPRAVSEAGPRGRGRRDRGRQPPRVPAPRVGPPAGLLLPPAGRSRGAARAGAAHDPLSEEGRGLLLHDPPGDRVVEAGAWYYPDPIDGAPPIKDLIGFYWNRIDQWFEEDEEVFVHPRDPYHRIDLLASDRHVRISLDGELLAESHRALALFETGLPTRWYLPREDVVAELEPSDKITRCPYKGTATYHSAGGEQDLVWCYEDPLTEVGRIAGLVCFFNERVDLELDGELQERPESPWSHGVRSEAPNAPPAETRG